MYVARLLLVCGVCAVATHAAAAPITASLEGCVAVGDSRLGDAVWFAHGTFQAVAFDDWQAGCGITILVPVHNVFVFDDDRALNTLTARLDMNSLPTCGRRQYDVHYYLEDGQLDPLGLKSLVIDTGVDCVVTCLVNCGVAGQTVPEPGMTAVLTLGLVYACRRRRRA